jgi:hypothetical protein
MTSHAFDAFADGNLDLQPDDGQQAAVNTLRDILALTAEDLPDAAVVSRVQVIARAALERFGGVPDLEDLGGPSGRWCDPLTADDGLVDLAAELQPPF